MLRYVLVGRRLSPGEFAHWINQPPINYNLGVDELSLFL